MLFGLVLAIAIPYFFIILLLRGGTLNLFGISCMMMGFLLMIIRIWNKWLLPTFQLLFEILILPRLVPG